MITHEIKTANKNFRIYRPDISLEEICRVNGPSIVRKMIPCFDFPDGVYNQDTEGNSFDNPKFTFVYGLNVRTPRVNHILPFFTTYIYKKGEVRKGKLRDDFRITEDIKLKVPDFTEKYKIREVFLYANIHKKGSFKARDIVILSMSTEKELKAEEFQSLKEDIAREDAFFSRHIKALNIQKRAYLWLTSEDYNVNKAGDALSNIIAVSDDYDAIAKYIMPCRLEFINLLFLIKARYLFDMEVAQRKTAIASAKAAIMSRNMSHNLGSHVMAYLKQHLYSVQDMVRDSVLDTVFSRQDDLDSEDGLKEWFERFKKKGPNLSTVALPFLVGLGKFISYLQERQDFIATIATDYVPYFSTVNFKDFVYDELNPDLRYERHKDRLGLKPDNILLGNIARSEGLARSTNPTKDKQMTDIVIKYRSFDGKITTEESEEEKALADMREFMIYLPGGVVGRQAIFSIVENVIRNAAKHGKWNGKDNNLELAFDRFYPEDFRQDNTIKADFVPIGDDTFDVFLKKYYAAASDIDDLCVVTLTDNTSFEESGTRVEDCKNLKAIQNALIEPYIDNASIDMLQTNKGIKEMRISAAWMRGIEDDVKLHPLYITENFDPDSEGADSEDHWIRVRPKVNERKNNFEYKYWKIEGLDRKAGEYWTEDDEQCWKESGKQGSKETKKQWVNKAPILMVRACTDKEGEDYHLQYVFCLPRPKEVAIVVSASLDPEVAAWFSKHAWNLFSVDSFLNARNKSYEFILLSEGIEEKDVKRIERVSPRRVLRQSQVQDILKIDDALSTKFTRFADVKEALYRKLCAFDPEEDVVIINDGKTEERIIKDLADCKPENVVIKSGEYKGKYLYRTHNDDEIQFTAYLNHADVKTRFVEGITGNNSTDRLVRNDKIDNLWLYKHLHAMKTSVGIFDERIFAKIYKKDEADIRSTLISLEDFKRSYSTDTATPDVKGKIRSAKTEEELREILGYDRREIKGDYMAVAYEKKGISIFNLLKTDLGLDIYGYGGILWYNDNKKCFSKIVKVGEIRQVDGKIHIDNPNNLRFNYLSIHQGLLDKVYEQFGIRHDALAKHEFTKAFYEAFSADTSLITYEDNDIKGPNGEAASVYYLPNLRIHSGRSKPSFADMPQHQPFIQYAAIEHAVLDCKYSLIELLDFARHE